jgi:hypothetical protein
VSKENQLVGCLSCKIDDSAIETSYLRASFVTLIAVFRGFVFGLFLGGSCDNLIYCGKVVDHGEEPFPASQSSKGNSISVKQLETKKFLFYGFDQNLII